MKRVRLIFIFGCLLSGCELNPPGIYIPTTPLTEEQRIAIAREDAETCNCGRTVDIQVSGTSN